METLYWAYDWDGGSNHYRLLFVYTNREYGEVILLVPDSGGVWRWRYDTNCYPKNGLEVRNNANNSVIALGEDYA
jgi:hypothetical protein